MNAHARLQDLLTAHAERSAPFPPLDGDGHSALLLDRESVIHLYADPEDPEAASFVLYMPLLSLRGTDDAAQTRMLWRVAEANAAGALPPAYALFGDADALAIYLGGQFSSERLEIGALETLTDEFFRLGQVLRDRLVRALEEEVAPASSPAPMPAPEEFPARLLGAGMLRA
ncbi:MAG: hypothetical protein LBE85_13380 [Candidatus Accumulibacter sp.]|jgi:hypothetical protein|nr:hypothetical protein [Accumulibacter sp.]